MCISAFRVFGRQYLPSISLKRVEYWTVVACTRQCTCSHAGNLPSSRLFPPLPSPLSLHLLAMATSSSPQASSSSTLAFQKIFEKALKEYKKKTGKDLTNHPLAAEINSCTSPEAILAILERKAGELNQSQSSDERLTKWLDPTVNILNALSATLGEGVGSVSYRNQPRYPSVT